MKRIIPPLLLAILMIAITSTGKAQFLPEAQTKLPSRLSLQAGYYGDMILHPGFYVGTQYRVWNNGWFLLHWDAEMGAYFHRSNHNAVFVKSGLGTRLSGPRGGFFDFNLGVGYLHTFPAGDVYGFNEAGIVEMKPSPGGPHLMPYFSFLTGWDLAKKRGIPVAISLGPEIFMEGQFNHTFLPHLVTRIGVAYQF